MAAATQKWVRLAHVYTSMIAFMLVLFFGFTGLTLNHPEWTFGSGETTTTTTKTLSVDPVKNGTIQFLTVSEAIRAKFGISAPVDSSTSTSDEGEIIYKEPGYVATAVFNLESARTTVTVTQQGWLGVLNDLHKGRDASSTWHAVIDVIAVFLMVIAVSGLWLQAYLRRRRRSAYIVAGIGLLLGILLIMQTL